MEPLLSLGTIVRQLPILTSPREVLPKLRTLLLYHWPSFSLLSLAVMFVAVLPWLTNSTVAIPLTFQFLYLTWVAGALWILLVLGSGFRRIYLPWTPLFIPPLLYLAARGVSWVFAMLTHHGLLGTYGIYSDGILYLVACYLFAYAVAAVARSPRRISAVLLLLYGQLVVLSLQVLGNAFSLGFLARTVRVITPLYNSNYFISYALLILPYGLIALVLSWRREQMLRFGAYLASLIVVCLALIACLPGPLQEMVLPWLGSERGGGGKSSAGFLADASNAERFTQWRLGWEIGTEHPLTGSGPGTTRPAFYQRVNSLPTWDYNVAMDHPHNDLIEQFSQFGVVGLLAYLATWGVLGYASVRRWRQLTSANRALISSLALGVALFLLFNLVHFTVVHTGIILWLIVALWVAALTNGDAVATDRARSAPPVPWAAIGVGVAVAAGMLALLPGTLRFYRADQEAVEATFASARGSYARAARLSQSAANRYPSEENYLRLAAANVMLHSLLTPGLGSDGRAAAAVTARRLAKRAIEQNPFIPEHIVDAGVVYYLTAGNGTAETDEGIRLMERGLKMSHWNPRLYRNITDAFIFRGLPSAQESSLEAIFSVAPAGMAETVATERARFRTSVKPSQLNTLTPAVTAPAANPNTLQVQQ